jgi:hypothetical protein
VSKGRYRENTNSHGKAGGENGLKQGDALSPLLFNFALE